jgi:acetyl esterase/lipase
MTSLYKLFTSIMVLTVIVGCFCFEVIEEFSPRQNKTLEYKSDLLGDLWLPKGRGPFPIVLTVHGGGWNGRDKADMNRICKRLTESGIAAFNINYRLAPHYLYPSPIEDFKDAVFFLKKNELSLNLDLTKMASWGYSAGAQIAALGSLELNRRFNFKSIINGAGPMDLTMDPENKFAVGFLGNSYVNDPILFKTASPLNYIDADSPPMFIYHSTNDQVVSFKHSLAIAEKYNQNNVEIKIHKVPVLGHYLTFLLSESSEALAISFLKEKFKL